MEKLEVRIRRSLTPKQLDSLNAVEMGAYGNDALLIFAEGVKIYGITTRLHDQGLTANTVDSNKIRVFWT